MPESKGRHGHHTRHPHAATPHARPKKKGRPIIVAVIFFALLVMGISYFVAPGNSTALVAGAIIGAIAGYFFGDQIEKSATKKEDR
jgi:hypothetical protein